MSIHTFPFLTKNDLWRIILVMIFRVIFNNTERSSKPKMHLNWYLNHLWLTLKEV